MNWNEFAQEVHRLVVEKGWWDPKPSFAEITVMCHSELSEAVKEYRAGRPMVYARCLGGDICKDDYDESDCSFRTVAPESPAGPCLSLSEKTEGVAVELADCILRILAVLTEVGIDIDGYRGFDPSATADLIETVAHCHFCICSAYIKRHLSNCYDGLMCCMGSILEWARLNDVDMEAVLREKHEYNKTRPYRHGGMKLRGGTSV